jgi:hypothetical protein
VTETQREPVPLVDGSELATAMAFLDFARGCALKKAAGLDEEQVRRVLVPSGTSILGLIQHLIDSEEYWIAHHLAGRPLRESLDFSMDVPPGRTAEEVMEGYRTAVRTSNEIIEAVGDPDALTAEPVHGEPRRLRWVLAHLTSETVRHAGHADILREQIDGVTGR